MIRKAEIKDIPGVIDLVSSRCIDSSVDLDERTGLIDYRIPDRRKYADRIAKGFFYVSEENGSVNGMIDAYTSSIIDSVFPNDEVISEIQRIYTHPCVYINSLAVSKSYEGRGVSSGLLKALQSDIKGIKTIWAAIVHKPMKNVCSANFALRKGFLLEKEMNAFGTYAFGLYRLSL